MQFEKVSPMHASKGVRDWNLGNASEPVLIGLYLVPGFPLLSVSAAIDPLRQANRLAGRTLYRWILVSEDGAAVTSSALIDFAADASIDTVPACDLVLVCAGIHVDHRASGRTLAWMRRLSRGGCRLGSLSTGSYLLAQAGLLEGRRCAVHWENASEFQETFPTIRMTHDIFSVDGPFITSSGGTVTLDMMLHIIGDTHGVALAAAISDQFNHSKIRLHDEAQRMDPEAKFGISNPKLCELIRIMEASIGAPLEVATLAYRVGLSRRQVERLFRAQLGQTPSQFYLALRMERARTLVTRSTLGLAEIARHCGYESAAYFSRIYRLQFGSTPAAVRRWAANGPHGHGRPAQGGRSDAIEA